MREDDHAISPQGTDLQNEPSAIAGFTTYEVGRMELAQRFLINVAAADLAPLAARVGYDSEEHRHGWRLWTCAAIDRKLARGTVRQRVLVPALGHDSPIPVPSLKP